MVARMSVPFFPLKAANTLSIAECHGTAVGLSMIQEQQSLTHSGHQCSGDNSYITSSIIGCKGGQNIDYVLQQ